MTKGFVKIPRAILSSQIWNEKRVYSRFEAYVDICNAADIKTHTMSFSLRRLADRWGWTLGKVQRFLATLAKESYIVMYVNETTTLKVNDTLSDTLTDTPTDTPNTPKTKGLRDVTDTPTDTLTDTPTDTLSRVYKNDNNIIMSKEEKKEEKKKECTSEDVHKKEELSCPHTSESDAFKKWMKENYPRVSAMKKPLTLLDFKKLQSANFKNEEIFSILNDMENWAKLNTKISAYLTALKWLKKL